MLSVVFYIAMLSVDRLSVVMLNVVAPNYNNDLNRKSLAKHSSLFVRSVKKRKRVVTLTPVEDVIKLFTDVIYGCS